MRRYLMKYQGMSLDDAFTHVKKTREIAQPNTGKLAWLHFQQKKYVFNSFFKKGFMEQLKKYEATLK